MKIGKFMKKVHETAKEKAYEKLLNNRKEVEEKIRSGQIEESEGINLIIQSNIEFMKQYC